MFQEQDYDNVFHTMQLYESKIKNRVLMAYEDDVRMLYVQDSEDYKINDDKLYKVLFSENPEPQNPKNKYLESFKVIQSFIKRNYDTLEEAFYLMSLDENLPQNAQELIL